MSAVELADPECSNGSEGFRSSLQRRVATRVGSVDVGRMLPMELVQRWMLAGIIAVAICAVMFMIPKMQFARRIARAMLPGVAIERASLTRVAILEPSPASGFVAEGDAVGVVVELSGGSPTRLSCAGGVRMANWKRRR